MASHLYFLTFLEEKEEKRPSGLFSYKGTNPIGSGFLILFITSSNFKDSSLDRAICPRYTASAYTLEGGETWGVGR